MTTDDRVLVELSATADEERVAAALTAAGLAGVPCQNLAELCREIGRGAAAVILSEEVLAADRAGLLRQALQDQPPWSDLPLVVLASDRPADGAELPAEGPNVTLVDRPLRARSLLAAVRAALRARRHQYQARARAAEREPVEDARARLAAIVESSDDAIISKDLDGIIRSWNGGAVRLYGYTPAEAIGRPITLIVPPDRLEEEQHLLARLRRGERIESFESVRVAKDGRLIDVSLTISPLRNRAGAVVGASKVARDISAPKRAAEALRQSESRFRALVTATSFAVYRMNADWTQMEQLDGQGFISDTDQPSAGWLERYIYPEDRPQVLRAIAEALRARRIFELKHRIRRADGSIGWTLSRAVPLLDDAGRLVEWFGAATDVTAYHRAEEALARVTEESAWRARLYEAALSTTPDLVYVFDLDHRFTYANEALLAMWGKTWDEAIGRTCLELGYEPWHAAMHDREIEQVVATKQPIRGEVPFTGTNGRRIYDYIFAPVFGTTGEVEAVAGITRDVTDRKAMEDALREADRKKDDFIAMLAHELRNPLAPIRNGLQVLRLAADDAAAVARARGIMERQLGHMVRLIDDLLDVSRISRNKIELQRARVRLADVVDSAVETARPQIDAEGHDLAITLPADPVYLDADFTRLAQVFGNLLTNSAKYTPRGGRIRLSAERHGGTVAVVVRDNGIGIPAASLGNIFDMFSQVNRAVERSAGGLGIGLALVKGLVEMHGGTVTAASPGEGRGSTFTVSLPALPAAADRPAAAENGHPAAAPRRVLVVDDNRDGADSLAMMLTLLGNDVRTAADGLQAVEMTESYRPDVILMDVGMPRLDGLAATRQIREQPWGRDVTIVALTGWGQEGDRQRSRQAGCDGHLLKPVGLPELQALLAELAHANGKR